MADLAFDERGLVASCPACGQKNRFLYGRLGDAGRFVPQRLEQPQHAIGARRRAQPDRTDQALAQLQRGRGVTQLEDVLGLR